MKFRYTPDNVYLVGGSVRDMILGKEVNDYDFVIDTSLENFQKESTLFLTNNFNKKGFQIGKFFPPTLRAVSENKIVADITLMDGDIRNDALRRDFTINAIFLSLKDSKIIDLLNFKKDILLKKIRITSQHSFTDDPLRMLRAVRLMGQLDNFTLTKETFNEIKKNSALIRKVSSERIRDEIEKIFSSKKCYILLKILVKTALIYQIFPELKCVKINFNSFKLLDKESFLKKDKVYAYLLLFDGVKNFTLINSALSRVKLPNGLKKLIISIHLKQDEFSLLSRNYSDEINLKKFVFQNYDILEYLLYAFKVREIEADFTQFFDSVDKIKADFKKMKHFIYNIVTGYDIINLGIQNGKIVGELLAELRFIIFLEKLKDKATIMERLNEIIRQKEFSQNI